MTHSRQTLTPSHPPLPSSALCLAGGGVTGAMYQVGCLAALEERYADFEATDFSMYIGAASGGTVAALLAGGISATRLYRSLLDPADDLFPLQRHHLLRFDMREWKRMALSSVGALRHAIASAANRPLNIDLWAEVDRFTDSLPAGIFNLDGYEKFLSEVLTRRGISSNFNSLPRKLLLLASDVDGGERIAFGEPPFDHIPLPRAVIASTALPPIFAPVRIQGRDYIDPGLGETGHTDLAEARGADFILCINPMVPVRTNVQGSAVPTGHGRKRRVRDKGMLWVVSQSTRLSAQSRFTLGLRRFRASHPGTSIVMLEPSPDDALMFMYSPVNFAARRTILEDGYRTTIHMLSKPDSPLSKAMANKGLLPVV